MKLIPVGHLRIRSTNYLEIVGEVFNAANLGESKIYVTPNLHHFTFSHFSNELKSLFCGFEDQLPDGWPIAFAAGVKSKSIVGRVSGSILLQRLLCHENVHALKLTIIGTYVESSGVFPNSVRIIDPGISEDLDELERKIKYDKSFVNFGTLVLCLGFPKQEMLAVRLQKHFRGPILCLGASLNFYLGIEKRPPRLWYRFGFEWLWRLCHDPIRLFKRYFLCLFVGIPILMWKMLKP